MAPAPVLSLPLVVTYEEPSLLRPGDLRSRPPVGPQFPSVLPWAIPASFPQRRTVRPTWPGPWA